MEWYQFLLSGAIPKLTQDRIEALMDVADSLGCYQPSVLLDRHEAAAVMSHLWAPPRQIGVLDTGATWYGQGASSSSYYDGRAIDLGRWVGLGLGCCCQALLLGCTPP